MNNLSNKEWCKDLKKDSKEGVNKPTLTKKVQTRIFNYKGGMYYYYWFKDEGRNAQLQNLITKGGIGKLFAP